MKRWIILLILTAGTAMAAESVTMESLLNEMVDRDRLATFPAPQYTCKQFSSYDRKSDDPDNKATWYCNEDWSQFIREEENAGRKEAVLFDAEGPGAIVRFWTTWIHHPEKTFRVYLDHNPEPVIEGKLTDFVDRGMLTGAPLSFNVSSLTEYDQRGHNLYLPIPYAKHCKITYETPVTERLYYNINYRTYEKGTTVESFSWESLKENTAAINQLRRKLLTDHGKAYADLHDFRDQTLKPGAKTSVAIAGPAAVSQISLTLDAKDIDQALRSTVLEIKFDGNRTVWCPVGDFFGTGHQLHPFRTWNTTVMVNGSMSCRWVMPFQKDCTVTLHNLNDQEVSIRMASVKSYPREWTDRSMYFHSTWFELNKIKTQTNKGADGGAFDVNFVTVDGGGVYVGDSLTLFNSDTGWWGEGDEKVYVDHETFPSHFGTGTEDYYGYAWCRPERFDNPFIAQPTGVGNLNKPGMSVNTRFRLLDGIPFTEKLQFDMELWHWNKATMNFAPVTFWYALPGATCNIAPDPESAALPVVKSIQDFMPSGAIEAEGLKILSSTGGKTEVQGGRNEIWSKGEQLWWSHAAIGDKLVLELPVETAGEYEIAANFTKAIDYAIVKISFNGKVLKDSVDLFNKDVVTDHIELGSANLKESVNLLEVEITGANEKAKKGYMFGIDYLLLKKSEF